MSAPGSHIAGKLVGNALHGWGGLGVPKPSYRSGPWEVSIIRSFSRSASGGVDMRLLHYGTTMLEWHLDYRTSLVTITGTWTGRGSASDQAGVNAALRRLGSNLYFSRVGVTKGRHRQTVDPSAARINHNPPTYYQAVALLRKVGMSLSKRWGEYRVAFRGAGNEHSAYYTSDLTDAMQTGLRMSKDAHRYGALYHR